MSGIAFEVMFLASVKGVRGSVDAGREVPFFCEGKLWLAWLNTVATSARINHLYLI